MRPIPLFTHPHFEKMVWGGKRLRERYNKFIPCDTTGESFEISVHPKGQTRIRAGEYGGMSLAQVADICGEALLGTGCTEFPLLIKLIDARDWLSVQVHPDDAYARIHEKGAKGKNEAWVILDAQPGAEIIYGIKGSAEAFAQAVDMGRVGDVLCRMPVEPGDVINIPAGAVHAIGQGILLYEVQQSSDITYRIYDWDRQPPRELHKEQAKEVVRPEIQPVKAAAEPVPGAAWRSQYIRNAFFTLEVWDIEAEVRMMTDGSTFYALTALDPGVVHYPGGAAQFAAGDSFILPATAGEYYMTGGKLIAAAMGGPTCA